jgi:phage shock protein C
MKGHKIKRRRLYRNVDEKMIGGVCAGLADHFNIDPTIVRLIFVMFGFLSCGLAIVCYLLLLIIVPVDSVVKKKGRVFEHED